MNQLVTEFVGGALYITLNREEKLNALSQSMLTDLLNVLKKVRNLKPHPTAIVLLGSGDRAFSTGADIGELKYMTGDEAKDISVLAQSVMHTLEALPMPTIAAIDGVALGGGLELALSCDLMYATEVSRLGLPEVSLGLIPGFGGCVRLPARVGIGQAKRMIFSGLPVTSDSAKNMGLVDETFTTKQEMMGAIAQFTEVIAKRSPHAIGVAKNVLKQGLDLLFEDAVAFENASYGIVFDHPEGQEGMSAFLEKRPADFNSVEFNS